MQILKSGSFLNLESAECVEALKFTARRLAEHSTEAVRENLNAQQLENLALQLWQKAEYVARETERRRLQQIFVENFTERFRELKPEVAVSTDENTGSLNQAFVAEEFANNETPADASAPSAGQSSEIAEKADEFLGFVKSDESFGDAPEREEKEATVEEISREGIESNPETVSETKEMSNQTVAAEADVSASKRFEETREIRAEKTEAPKPQPIAEHDSPATNQTNKTSTEAKEPFEFGKCAVSLNLTLLAGSGTGRNRQVIISTASHNLPPEIELVEIADGEDLGQITELVKNKLERFRQSLPVKYIDELRASKSKTAKRNTPVKPAATALAATPDKAESQTDVEKKSGEQEKEEEGRQNSNGIEGLNAQSSVPMPAPIPKVTPGSTSANNVQPSLF